MLQATKHHNDYDLQGPKIIIFEIQNIVFAGHQAATARTAPAADPPTASCKATLFTESRLDLRGDFPNFFTSYFDGYSIPSVLHSPQLQIH